MKTKLNWKHLPSLAVSTLSMVYLTLAMSLHAGDNKKASIIRGSEVKPLTFEFDGIQYLAYAHIDYQYEILPTGKFNWSGHGYLIGLAVWNPEVNDWVCLENILLPKRAINADDPRDFVGEEKVKITPTGNVMVNAHGEYWN